MSQKKKCNYLLWIDLEMTGLNEKQDKVLEFAAILTDYKNLERIDGFDMIIHQSDDVLDNMDYYSKNLHYNSGLTAKCRISKNTEKMAEEKTLKLLEQYKIKSETCLLAGNSIHVDRYFLKEYFPNLNKFLNYRNIDVSSIKECYLRWGSPDMPKLPKKKLNHRALDDILESIEELKFYRKQLFPKS